VAGDLTLRKSLTGALQILLPDLWDRPSARMEQFTSRPVEPWWHWKPRP